MPKNATTYVIPEAESMKASWDPDAPNANNSSKGTEEGILIDADNPYREPFGTGGYGGYSGQGLNVASVPAADLKVKSWAEGQPSNYQLHDTTNFPDWGVIIKLDAYFNNLASGFLIASVLVWLIHPVIFGFVAPICWTVAFFIVVFDLLLLIIDLGDHFRFIHTLRIFRPTSPLSVGVYGLVGFTILLFIALVLYWILFGITAYTHGVGIAVAAEVLSILITIFIILAALCGFIVICYKGVAFSCTSQPGVKDARFLAPLMVTDSLLMGLGLIAIVAIFTDTPLAMMAVSAPLAIMIILRCVAFGLLYSNVRERSLLVYGRGLNNLTLLLVYVLAGAIAFFTTFCGPWGVLATGILVLLAGIWERFWVLGLAKPM